MVFFCTFECEILISIMLKLISITFLSFLYLTSFAQLPAKQVNLAALKTEVYGGITMHTSGWGAHLYYSKFITAKSERLFFTDILTMKHSKEIKIQGYVDQNSKDFVYGKLNGLFITRLGYGKKYNLYEKQRDKGVDISWIWGIGPSFGFLKPVYLDVVNISPNGKISAPLQEAYNPEKHNLGNIYGRSKGIRGLAETKIIPGAFAKVGFEFEYNNDREFIRTISTGVTVDVFPKTIEIMAFAKNTFIFPSLYINVSLGRRYF